MKVVYHLCQLDLSNTKSLLVGYWIDKTASIFYLGDVKLI